MHTIMVIAGGMLLLGAFLFIARLRAPGQSLVAPAAKWFIAAWLAATLVNLWYGVTRAGDSPAEEAPIQLLVFAVPALLAAIIWLRSR